MRRVVLTLAVLALVGLTARSAFAASRYGGPRGYGGYSSRLGYYSSGQFGYGSHLEAARRIMAYHSRYRYQTHPRSSYNSPPLGRGYYGRGYGPGQYGGGFQFQYRGGGYGY